MIRRIGLAVLAFALCSVAALAADFNGKWTAEFDTQIGVQKYTYEFHVDGAKLTGKAMSELGETELQEGKIDGDNITFVENLNFQGNQLRIVYTGKIDGDQIKFTRQVADFATEELIAKRVK
jgi:serine protease inhibitor